MGLGLVKMWRRGVETGSVGIEKKISVFIQPTLESRKLVTKEEAKPRYYYLERVRWYSLVTIHANWGGGNLGTSVNFVERVENRHRERGGQYWTI